MNVRFKCFRGTLISWEGLFEQACDFASQIGKEKLISISHSDNHSKGVVTVWCWSEK